MIDNTFTLSIETAEGNSYQHGYHLGTDEALARQIAAATFSARVANGLPVVTVALMRDGRIVDCYDGDWLGRTRKSVTRTYWKLHPRNFGNEFTVGIATSQAHAEQYAAEGYRRITRDEALRLMSRRFASNEQDYSKTEIDGEPVDNRFLVARDIRNGRVPAVQS